MNARVERAALLDAHVGRAASLDAHVERALRPIDRLRAALIRALAGWVPARRVLVRRTARVPALLAVHAAGAFVLALLVPSLSLLVSPLVLGVPHIAADVRYLVLRREVPRSLRAVTWPLALSLVALRAAAEAGVLRVSPLYLEHALGASWVLLGAAAGWSLPRSRTRAALASALAAGVAVFALAWPGPFRLVLVHAHNLIAVVIWLALFRRGQRMPWLTLAWVLGGAVVLASGALLDVTLRHGVLSVLGLHLFAAADWLAPGLDDRQGVALTVSFAYLQAVHYAIWLSAIPQQDTSAQGSTTFRMAWRSLLRDLGRSGVALTVCMSALVLVAGVLAPVIARHLFLSLVTFHAWLELALLACLLSRVGAPHTHHPPIGDNALRGGART